MWNRFKKHKVGMISAVLFLLIFVITLFADFFAPYSLTQAIGPSSAPPQRIRFIDEEGKFNFRPFVYGRRRVVDLSSRQVVTVDDPSQRHFIHFFVRGETSYKILGLIRTNIRLFGTEDGVINLLGTDSLGRDLFSRILYGGRVSLTIGFLGVAACLVLGIPIGLISGFRGGLVDMVLQRVLEVFRVIPYVPLALALAAFLPPTLPPLQLIVGVTLVIIVPRWTGLARQIRGKVLALREEDYVAAAKALGASNLRILATHLLPNLWGLVVVYSTLTIPIVIVAESGMSFLGFGIRPPMTSWGMLLREAQNLSTLQFHWWKLLPGAVLTISVLTLNFVGDGIRDALDPYRKS